MARAHEVLGGRWTLLIVREILSGSRRFNDIRRGVPRVSRTVLSERLQELVLVGAIARTDGPHGPEYELTEAGRELVTLTTPAQPKFVCVAFSPDDRFLAAIGEPVEVVVWGVKPALAKSPESRKR